MLYKISKNNLKDYINYLLERYEVWGPKKINNDYVFSRIKNGNEFSDVRTLLGPKDLIYPPQEKLFEDYFHEIIVLGVKSL